VRADGPSSMMKKTQTTASKRQGALSWTKFRVLVSQKRVSVVRPSSIASSKHLVTKKAASTAKSDSETPKRSSAQARLRSESSRSIAAQFFTA